jgi:hypothetical protein
MQRMNFSMTRVGERLAVDRRMLVRALGLASLVSMVGCVADHDMRLPDEPVQTRAESFEYWQWTAAPLDVLFVVDNSPEIAEHEQRIATNLPALGSLIDKSGWVDMRIGITTADVGCADHRAWRYDDQLTNAQFLIDWRHLDDTRTKNFDGELPPQITRLATAGHAGCGHHRPFDAIVDALDPSTGFRRDDADLVIVVIAASDDQSTLSVEDLMLAIGPLPPSPSAPAVIAALPANANRLQSFAQQFEHRIVNAITADDFLAATWSFGLRRSLVGPPCFAAEAFDTSAADGIQASCSISDRVREDRGTEVGAVIYERVLPACNGSNRPCWRFEESPRHCNWSDQHFELKIDRVDFPPIGTVLVGQCEILENAWE